MESFAVINYPACIATWSCVLQIQCTCALLHLLINEFAGGLFGDRSKCCVFLLSVAMQSQTE